MSTEYKANSFPGCTHCLFLAQCSSTSSLGSKSNSKKTMACLLYTQLFLLNTFILFLNLSLNPVLGQILAGIEKSIIEEEGALEALNFAVSEYNENNSDLYLSRVVEVKTVKTVQQQVCDS